MGSPLYIKGLDQLNARLKDLSSNLKEEIDAEMSAAATDIARIAATKAPVNQKKKNGGLLKGSIKDDVSVPFHKKVIVSRKYAAYVEFGTGRAAAKYVPSLPKEWQDEAKTHFVNGKGRNKEQPFLYPAFSAIIPNLIKQIRDLIKL
jgi:HK97 gp10 family phage protein